ncbi:hypothetical protein ACFLZI_01085 [Nitrospirota bacterium]
MGTVNSIPYLFQGWINAQELNGVKFALMHGNRSTVLAHLSTQKDYEIIIRARGDNIINGGHLSLYLNNHKLTSIDPSIYWGTYKLPIPKEYVKDGLNKIYFSSSISAPGRNKAYSQFYNLHDKWHPISDDVLFWEIDNSKFKNIPISYAVDYMNIRNIVN